MNQGNVRLVSCDGDTISSRTLTRVTTSSASSDVLVAVTATVSLSTRKTRRVSVPVEIFFNNKVHNFPSFHMSGKYKISSDLININKKIRKEKQFQKIDESQKPPSLLISPRTHDSHSKYERISESVQCKYPPSVQWHLSGKCQSPTSHTPHSRVHRQHSFPWILTSFRETSRETKLYRHQQFPRPCQSAQHDEEDRVATSCRHVPYKIENTALRPLRETTSRGNRRTSSAPHFWYPDIAVSVHMCEGADPPSFPSWFSPSQSKHWIVGLCVIWTPQVCHQRSGWSSVMQPCRECCLTSCWATRRTPDSCSGTGHWWIEIAELLKLQRSGQFPDDLVKREGAQIHCVTCRTY